MRAANLFWMLLITASPVAADELRDFCPTRPGLGTNACIVDASHAVAELSAVDWTRTRDNAATEDRTLAGDLLLRIGLGATTELQLGWTPFGVVRTRDRLAGTTATQHRIGDVTLGLRQNLASPDGSGFSAAVQPFVTLPIGRQPVGDGDWGAGLVVPISYELSETWSVALTSEADAAVDSDGNGRHLAWSAIGGATYKLSDSVSATIEAAALRDDPARHETEWRGALSLAWQPKDGLQFDVQAVAGLDRDAPDVELIAGLARRF